MPDARRHGQGSGGWLFLAGMALCHSLSDFYATMLTPLVETFRDQFGLDKAGIALVGAAVGVFGSMAQPLFGIWSDRRDRGLLAAGGLAVSAVFMSLIGFSPNVVVLVALLIAGALGVAAFHPTSAVLATRHTAKRSLSMGIFLAGGGLGLMLTPLIVPAMADRYGLRSLWVLCFPGILLSIWAYAATRGPLPEPKERKRLALREMFARGTGAIWALLAMATLRSLVVTAFVFFITVLGATRGWDRATSGRVLSLFLGCGFVGGLLGGYLGQTREPRWVLVVSCVAAAPLYHLFAGGSGWPSLVAFGGAGLLFGVGNPVNVAFAQELRPQSASMVSGLMMGLAWGLANALLIPVGALAEVYGIGRVLQLVAWLSALSAAFAFFLPSREGGRG